jgi:YidC/Oxa1 family membrane protein insertase
LGFFEIFSTALTGFYALIPSLGLAIILLTIAVRLILLPLSIKQTRSMREMQRIQPEVKRLQQKHKGDRQKMNEEMMALYKEHGVNPFGGCFPLLLQFPVLIGLFYVVREPLKYMGYSLPKGASGRAADYLPRPDLSGVMDTLQNSRLAEDLLSHAQRVNEFLGIRLDCTSQLALSNEGSSLVPQPTCGDGVISALPYLLLVILMGATTWYQQKQMQATSGSDQQSQQMQTFAKIMPIMLMFFAFTFPSGVVLYWLTTNVWTIGQQRLMLRAAPPISVGGDGKAAPPTRAAAKPQTGAPPKQTEPTGPAKKPHPSSKKKKRKR